MGSSPKTRCSSQFQPTWKYSRNGRRRWPSISCFLHSRTSAVISWFRRSPSLHAAAWRNYCSSFWFFIFERFSLDLSCNEKRNCTYFPDQCLWVFYRHLCFHKNRFRGEPTVRTHCVTRVSNQKSLFHISAGINYSDPKSKDKNGQKPNPSVPPIKSSSPKLPPFPTPTVILPVVQIKQVQQSHLFSY